MASSLLELPPELRNRICDFVFIDSAPEEGLIQLFEAGKHVPQKALTRVNRQMRHETLALFRAATLKFWSAHPLLIAVDCISAGKRRHAENNTAELAKLRHESGAGMVVTMIAFHVTTGKVYGRLGLPLGLHARNLERMMVALEVFDDEEDEDCYVGGNCEFMGRTRGGPRNFLDDMQDAMYSEMNDYIAKPGNGILKRRRIQSGQRLVRGSLDVERCLQAVLCVF